MYNFLRSTLVNKKSVIKIKLALFKSFIRKKATKRALLNDIFSDRAALPRRMRRNKLGTK